MCDLAKAKRARKRAKWAEFVALRAIQPYLAKKQAEFNNLLLGVGLE